MTTDFAYVRGTPPSGLDAARAWVDADGLALKATSWYPIPGFSDVHLVSDNGVIVTNRNYSGSHTGTAIVLPRKKTGAAGTRVVLLRPQVPSGPAGGMPGVVETKLRTDNVVRAALEDRHHEWRVFPAAEEYEVSAIGEVRSRRNLNLVAPWNADGYGHMAISLRVDGQHRCFPLQQVVALTWIALPAEPRALLVDHVDRDPGNNVACNLRWASRIERLTNVSPSVRAKAAGMLEVADSLIANGEPKVVVARSLGVAQGQVELRLRRLKLMANREEPGSDHLPRRARAAPLLASWPTKGNSWLTAARMDTLRTVRARLDADINAPEVHGIAWCGKAVANHYRNAGPGSGA